jgi:membrane-associated protease RseP (regulator of RpoE activity)
VNLVLFGLTLISTLWVGSSATVEIGTWQELVRSFLPQNLLPGWPFAVTLLTILTAHEFGHYFAARYHKLSVTLPYFLPLPLPPIGTLGAFIRLKEPIPDRRKLFDVGVAGPLAGFVLAVPLLIYGLSTSPIIHFDPTSGGIMEGNSLLYYSAKLITFGKALPNALTGEDVLLNQIAMAAWIGLLVTALNLLPVGQLDGGHTVFALFGEKARYFNLVTVGAMAVFAVAGLEQVQQFLPFLSTVGFTGWFVWLGLIFFMIGPYHPPALDDVTRLDPTRRWLGYAMILIFILTFVPVPLRIMM